MAEVVCPYLGIEEDAETAVAFPSPRNRCFRAGGPAFVTELHQDGYCLRNVYTQCPVFLLKQTAGIQPGKALPQIAAASSPSGNSGKPAASKPIPAATPGKQAPPLPQPKTDQQRVPQAPPQKARLNSTTQVGPAKPFVKPRNIKDMILTGLMGGGIMAILLAAILILPAYGPQMFGARPDPSELTPQRVETGSSLISQPSSLEPVFTETKTLMVTASVTATRMPSTPTATRTHRPTRTLTATRAHSEIPPTVTQQFTNCGVPYGWTRYIVQPGDTLTSLSQRTQASVFQLQTANCMGTSTLLYAGMTIYVPFLPAPANPTQISPTNTKKPTRPPSTSTPVPTNTVVVPSATIVQTPTVEPTPILPSATPVTPEPEPTSVTPVVSKEGGAS